MDLKNHEGDSEYCCRLFGVKLEVIWNTMIQIRVRTL